jgi:hypothetical protein
LQSWGNAAAVTCLGNHLLLRIQATAPEAIVHTGPANAMPQKAQKGPHLLADPMQ